MTDKPLPSKKWWNNTKVMMQHWEDRIRADERRKMKQNENYVKIFNKGYAKGNPKLDSGICSHELSKPEKLKKVMK